MTNCVRSWSLLLGLGLVVAGCSDEESFLGSTAAGGSAGVAGSSGQSGAAGAGAGTGGASGVSGASGQQTGGASGAGNGGSAGGGQGGATGGGAGQGGAAGTGGTLDPSQGAWAVDFGLPGLVGDGAQAGALVRAADGSLVIGGTFEWADGVEVHNVARWDGTAWSALGDGLPFGVRAMAYDEKGVLYAGGGHGPDDGRLARWTGGAWEVLPGATGPVMSLAAAPGGGVFVGGNVQLGGQAFLVAKHDGTTWTGLGKASEEGLGTVSALLPGESGQVCAGGSFGQIDGQTVNNVACFDGATWTAFGGADGLPGEVFKLLRHSDGTVYAAGTFTFVVDMETGEYRAGLGRYSETKKRWEAFEGVDNGFVNTVRSLTEEADGSLLVGGLFNDVSPSHVPAINLARWKNGVWSQVAPVATKVGLFLPSAAGVYDTVAANGEVFVAGFFSEVGGRPAVSVAKVNGAGAVQALSADVNKLQGLDGFADAVTLDRQGRLVVGGSFSHAGTTKAYNVARWEGSKWAAVGEGLAGIVRVLREDKEGTLWAGGEIGLIGAPYLLGVTRFEGGEWKAAGDPLDAPVFAATTDQAGQIVIGGDFTVSGSTSVGHVARWDGSTWQPLGDGLDQRVSALAIDAEGRVFAGGLFQTVNGQPSRGLAVFEGGEWKTVGGGVDDEMGYVAALAIGADGKLLVGGPFDSIGGVKAGGLARWNGTSFEALGTGLTSDNDAQVYVTALTVAGQGLFVGGTFTGASGKGARYVTWRGPDGSWKPLAQGLGDLPEEIAVAGNAVWVGGPFLTAGERPSNGIARYDVTSP